MDTTDRRLLRTFGPRPTQAVCEPWTAPQVRLLNRWQRKRPALAYRCPLHANVEAIYNPLLIAKFDGWMCSQPGCGFRLSWAHPEMFVCITGEPRQEKRQRLVEWNERYPSPGVSVKYDDPVRNYVVRTRTMSRAFMHRLLKTPVVRLKGVKEPVVLEDVMT